MGKKNRKTKAVSDATDNELKDVCLHCAFLEMHQEKWPGWRPDAPEGAYAKQQEAFNDLVHSTAKITAEVFLMLTPQDQFMFFRQVFYMYKSMQEGGDSDPTSMAEMIEMFKAQFNTKH